MKKITIVLLLMWMASATVLAQPLYQVYPVPHVQEIGVGQARLDAQVAIVAEEGIDGPTVARAKEILQEQGCTVSLVRKPVKGGTNLFLGLNGSRGVADREATRRGLSRQVFQQPKYDRHIVSLVADKKGRAQLLVVGENTDAVFCGLATVEQMLDRGREALPCVRFYDYADIRTRGIIEGYYGVPYNAQVTKDLFRFMARYKLNTYMYGAKSDPYHTRFWADPYPTTVTPEQEHIGYLTQDMLRDIVGVAHSAKVNFIWAIHPGAAFTDSKQTDVVERIMTKLGYMYDLGVRQFGLFVDDIGVPTDSATLRLNAQRVTELQNSIDARWNQSGAAPADTVKPLQFVPQLYAFSWVKPEVGERFFRSLGNTPDKVDIYITGRNVWSVPNSQDLATAGGWLGRQTAWWWNYPCNDNDVTKLFPMDMYTNFRDEKHIDGKARLEPSLRGTNTLIANPMQQGEASKIALFGLADYAWNNQTFDHQRNWLASLPAVVGRNHADALRCVAPCLRYFDEGALAEAIKVYKEATEHNEGLKPGMLGAVNTHVRELLKELENVQAACDELIALKDADEESLRLFYADIEPWLLKLRTMANLAIALLNGQAPAVVPDLEQDPAFQFEILTGLGEDIALDVKTAEPSAQVLRPFVDWLLKRHATKP